jgi:small redox-active disulfide protein 2
MVTLEILGMGCAKCSVLAERTEQAARELELAYQLEKVTDIEHITAYGVMSTPALAVDGVLQFAGRVPTVSALKELLAPNITSRASLSTPIRLAPESTEG